MIRDFLGLVSLVILVSGCEEPLDQFIERTTAEVRAQPISIEFARLYAANIDRREERCARKIDDNDDEADEMIREIFASMAKRSRAMCSAYKRAAAESEIVLNESLSRDGLMGDLWVFTVYEMTSGVKRRLHINYVEETVGPFISKKKCDEVEGGVRAATVATTICTEWNGGYVLLPTYR